MVEKTRDESKEGRKWQHGRDSLNRNGDGGL